MNIVKETKYVLFHKPTGSIYNSSPNFYMMEPSSNYREGNMNVQAYFNTKVVMYDNDKYKYISAMAVVSKPLTLENIKNLKTYKKQGRPKSILNKLRHYCDLFDEYPVLEDNGWRTKKTSKSQNKKDRQFIDEVSIVPIQVERDLDEVVVFKDGVRKVEQFAKGTAHYCCWACGMKMKKLPGFLFRKPGGSQRMFLCPICAQGIAEAGKSMVASMGEEFVEKVKKQLFIKKLTEL